MVARAHNVAQRTRFPLRLCCLFAVRCVCVSVCFRTSSTHCGLAASVCVHNALSILFGTCTNAHILTVVVVLTIFYITCARVQAVCKPHMSAPVRRCSVAVAAASMESQSQGFCARPLPLRSAAVCRRMCVVFVHEFNAVFRLPPDWYLLFYIYCLCVILHFMMNCECAHKYAMIAVTMKPFSYTYYAFLYFIQIIAQSCRDSGEFT